MNEQVCNVPECTFPQTGQCMKNYAPEECPSHMDALNFLRTSSENNIVDGNSHSTDGIDRAGSEIQFGDAVLPSPDEKPKLPRSGTLGLSDADHLMQSRRVNVIGIVGFPNAGKTACLASLYLLLSRRSLDGFTYLNSRTLMAFEEISRGIRRWNDGNPPVQMTAHTQLADDRQAGFLHLRLRRNSDQNKFDILLPDLPGEWSRSLHATGKSERFAFLRSADVIWLMANGSEFLDVTMRAGAMYRATILIERLASIFQKSKPRIIFVATWHDVGAFPEVAYQKIQECGEKNGFNIEFAPIASFSDGDTDPGYGVARLIEQSIATVVERPPFWPSRRSVVSDREFLNFGRFP